MVVSEQCRAKWFKMFPDRGCNFGWLSLEIMTEAAVLNHVRALVACTTVDEQKLKI